MANDARLEEYWRPVYVVEQDADGNCVVFAPNVPDASTGTIMLAQRHEVVLVPSLSAKDLDVSLKKRGARLATLTKGGHAWLSPASS